MVNEDGGPTQRGGAAWRVSIVQRLCESHRLNREAGANLTHSSALPVAPL
jgi:hypothetical protein